MSPQRIRASRRKGDRAPAGSVLVARPTRWGNPFDWKQVGKPEAGIGSLLRWQAMGLSIHMAGDHERAGRHAARLLYTVAKRRYRELRSLCADSPEEEQRCED